MLYMNFIIKCINKSKTTNTIEKLSISTDNKEFKEEFKSNFIKSLNQFSIFEIEYNISTIKGTKVHLVGSVPSQYLTTTPNDTTKDNLSELSEC